ncbi:hypothetical protein R1sor_015982 [Riccia sorocarpa]|uniref:Uncharacterized protein n=1 Tax=Riccia sorocarpa TaxID=122646 RepID=A0ABD3HDQ3_9MARC
MVACALAGRSSFGVVTKARHGQVAVNHQYKAAIAAGRHGVVSGWELIQRGTWSKDSAAGTVISQHFLETAGWDSARVRFL